MALDSGGLGSVWGGARRQIRVGTDSMKGAGFHSNLNSEYIACFA